jgi:2'-5' RNA ligase
MRLFFAIWPDAAARDDLAALALDVAAVARGKPVPSANLHLTLAFLGEVDEARADLLPGIAAAVEARAFAMELDRVGSFPRARVAWAGCAKPTAALVRLQSALVNGLSRRGFALEDRPFAPHLTLARKTLAPLPPARIDPIAWEVGEFALVRSRAGRYETAASWRLG